MYYLRLVGLVPTDLGFTSHEDMMMRQIDDFFSNAHADFI